MEKVEFDDMFDTFSEFLREQNETFVEEVVNYFLIVVLNRKIKEILSSGSQKADINLVVLKNNGLNKRRAKPEEICQILNKPRKENLYNYLFRRRPIQYKKLSKIEDDEIKSLYICDRLSVMVYDELKRRIRPYLNDKCKLKNNGLELSLYADTLNKKSIGNIGLKISGPVSSIVSFYYDQVQAYGYNHGDREYSESLEETAKPLLLQKRHVA